MIILIGLLLSAIIVAPKSIQQEQKAAQNAEQRAEIADILKLHNVERSAQFFVKDEYSIAYDKWMNSFLDTCRSYEAYMKMPSKTGYSQRSQIRRLLTPEQLAGLFALCRLPDTPFLNTVVL